MLDSLSSLEQSTEDKLKFLSNLQLPAITLRLNLPKELHQRDYANELFAAALSALDIKLKQHMITIADQRIARNSRHEAMFSIHFKSVTVVKKLMIEIEQRHPWGALFNFDVMCEQGKTLSRRSAYMEPRKCIVCDNTAQRCAGIKRHNSETIEHAIINLMAP